MHINSILIAGALLCIFASCEPKKGPNPGEPLSAGELVQNSQTAEPEKSKIDPATLPIIEFADSIKDFGTITEGDLVSYIFRFKNTGKSPLIISNASGSCGCTVPRWPKDPIVPGDTGSVSVAFNSQGKFGHQVKTVTVVSNTEPSVKKLTFQ